MVREQQASQMRGQRGALHPRWRGGRYQDRDGYVLIWEPEHPRNTTRYVPEHVLVAEGVLGRYLPAGAVVHHVNEQRADNRPINLVVCQNNAYHHLLHRRTRAFIACGRPSWRKCPFCKRYDSPDNLIRHGGSRVHHACRNAAGREYMRRRRS